MKWEKCLFLLSGFSFTNIQDSQVHREAISLIPPYLSHIFFLPREFKEKNKNTGNDNENSLADLRISQEKKFPFLDLHVTENFLQNLCFFYSQSIVYHAISLASEQHFHSDLQLQRKFIGNFSIGYYSEPKCIILCSCSYRVLFCDTELAFV